MSPCRGVDSDSGGDGGGGGGGGDAGGGGSVTDKKDALLRVSNGVARVPTPCRLLATVEDEDGGASVSRQHKNAVECQRVGSGCGRSVLGNEVCYYGRYWGCAFKPNHCISDRRGRGRLIHCN